MSENTGDFVSRFMPDTETLQDGQLARVQSRMDGLLREWGTKTQESDAITVSLEDAYTYTPDKGEPVTFGLAKITESRQPDAPVYELHARTGGITEVPIRIVNGSLHTYLGESSPSGNLAQDVAELSGILDSIAKNCDAKQNHEIWARRERVEKRTSILKRTVGSIAAIGVLAGAGFGAYRISQQDPDQDFDDQNYTLIGGTVGSSNETIHPAQSYELKLSQRLAGDNIPSVSSGDPFTVEDGLRQIVFNSSNRNGNYIDKRCVAAAIDGPLPQGTQLRAWSDYTYNGAPRANELDVTLTPDSREVVACWTGKNYDTSQRLRAVIDLQPAK